MFPRTSGKLKYLNEIALLSRKAIATNEVQQHPGKTRNHPIQIHYNLKKTRNQLCSTTSVENCSSQSGSTTPQKSYVRNQNLCFESDCITLQKKSYSNQCGSTTPKNVLTIQSKSTTIKKKPVATKKAPLLPGKAITTCQALLHFYNNHKTVTVLKDRTHAFINCVL